MIKCTRKLTVLEKKRFFHVGHRTTYSTYKVPLLGLFFFILITTRYIEMEVESYSGKLAHLNCSDPNMKFNCTNQSGYNWSSTSRSAFGNRKKVNGKDHKVIVKNTSNVNTVDEVSKTYFKKMKNTADEVSLTENKWMNKTLALNRKTSLNEKSSSKNERQSDENQGPKYDNTVNRKYVMHKKMKDVGPTVSARERALLVKDRCLIFQMENKFDSEMKVMRKFNHESFMMISNLTICSNCKVMSTNIKRILYTLENKYQGDVNNLKVRPTRLFSRTLRRPIREVLADKQNIRFMFVREPLERLLSAYRDERGYPNMYKNNSFSFHDFLKLVVKQDFLKMDRHIFPYYERCHPCKLEYDFIGISAYFKSDMKVVLRSIHAGSNVKVPKREKTGYWSISTDKLVQGYYKDIPNEIIHKLWEKYYKDYYIFGFPYPSHLMT